MISALISAAIFVCGVTMMRNVKLIIIIVVTVIMSLVYYRIDFGGLLGQLGNGALSSIGKSLKSTGYALQKSDNSISKLIGRIAVPFGGVVQAAGENVVAGMGKFVTKIGDAYVELAESVTAVPVFSALAPLVKSCGKFMIGLGASDK